MKKLIAFLLLAALILTVAVSCTKERTDAQTEKPSPVSPVSGGDTASDGSLGVGGEGDPVTVDWND